jgi:hypothetical protein
VSGRVAVPLAGAGTYFSSRLLEAREHAHQKCTRRHIARCQALTAE